MPSSVNIGTVEGFIKLRDEFTAELGKVTARLDQFDSRLKKMEEGVRRTSTKAKTETEKITEAYKKLAGSLDPVVAGQHKYESAVRTLQSALSKGVITQTEYNRQLTAAKSRFLDAEHGGNRFHSLLDRVNSLAGSSGQIAQQMAGRFGNVVTQVGALGTSFAALAGGAAIIISLGAAVVGLGLAWKGVSYVIDSVRDAMDIQVLVGQLNHSLKANGAAAGYSSAELLKYAESLVRVTGREDEAIAAGQLILTRFSKIGHDTFPVATRAALDLAQATGKSLTESFTTVGKALQEPGRGLASLKDIGITFTASQRKTLQALVETNKIAEYQSTILSVLQEKVGGAAEAYTHTLAGGIAVARAEMSEFGEGIASEVIPALEFLMSDIVGSLGGWENLHSTIESTSHRIGNLIREMIFNIIISFHEWAAEQELTLARSLDSLRDYTGVLSNLVITIKAVLRSLSTAVQTEFQSITTAARIGVRALEIAAKAVSLLPGSKLKPNAAGDEVTALQKQIDALLAKSAENLRKSAITNIRSANAGRDALKEHRLALEGDTKAHKFRGDAIDGVANKEGKHSERLKEKMARIRELIAAMKAEMETARQRFNLVGATDAELLKQEVAEARLAAAQKLGSDATAAQIREAQRYAAITATVVHATRNREAAERDLAKAASDRIRAQFEANVSQQSIFKGPLEYGSAISTKVVESIFLQLKQRADEFAAGVKASLITTREAYDQEIAKVKSAVKSNRLTAEEGAEAVARIERARWDETLSTANDALGYLADRFGGFFAYLQDLVNSVQQARQFGQSVGQTASSLGASVQTASALSSVASVFAIYYAIYTGVQDWIKKKNLKKFGQVNTYSVSDSIENALIRDNPDTKRIDEWGRGFVSSIREVVRGIEEALGIAVTDLAKITVKFRRDGEQIRAYVGDTFVGLFTDINDAISAAMVVALRSADTQIRGLTDLMKQGLTTRIRAEDLDEFTRFLSQLREIGDLGLSEGSIHLRDFTRHLDELFIALTKLKVTPAVLQGFDQLTAARAREYQAWRNQITGHQETQAELRARMEGEARLFNARKALDIADLKLQLAKYRQEAELVRVRGQLGGVDGRIGRQRLQLQYDEMKVRVALVGAEKSLLETQLEMYDVVVKALEDTIAALEAIPDIDIGEIKLPKVGGAGGGAGQDNVLEFIKGKGLDLALNKLGEYARRVAEVTREYDPLIAQTKAESSARRELIGLRNEELRQLAQEKALSTVSAFRQFLGLVTPFDQIRDTAADLIRTINDSPFGDARKARMVSRVLGEVERQIERLSRESAVSLFGEMSGELEKFGADAKLIGEVQRAQAVLEHTLKLAHYRVEIEILRAQGKLSLGVLATLDKSLAFLEGIDPLKFIGGGASDTRRPLSGKALADAVAADKATVAGTDAAKDLADALQSARDKLRRYQDDGLDPLTASLIAITTDFLEIRRALGNTPEVIATESAAVARALASFLDPIRDLQSDLLYGEQSTLDTVGKWGQAQTDFLDIQRRFRAGDLSVVEGIPDMIQQFLGLAREVTPVGSVEYARIFTEANRFLNEVLSITPDTLGTGGNPMTVAGMNDLTILSEAQIERLDRIYASSERVVNAIAAMHAPVTSAAGVA